MNKASKKQPAKPFQQVEDLEKFFKTEFTAEQLEAAINDLAVFEKDVAKHYGLEKGDAKTFALGTIAAVELQKRLDIKPDTPLGENKFKNSYEVGVEIAKGRFNDLKHAQDLIEKALMAPVEVDLVRNKETDTLGVKDPIHGARQKAEKGAVKRFVSSQKKRSGGMEM